MEGEEEGENSMSIFGGWGDNQLRTIKLHGLDIIILLLFLPFLNH